MSFSHMACNNTVQNCYYNELIPTDKYFEHISTIIGSNDEEINNLRNKYICGSNTLNTSIQECCLKTDESIKENNNGKLIKIIKDENDNIIEYRVCNCKNKICEDKMCKDFRKPSFYESCKARSSDSNKMNKISQFEYGIVKENCISDCNDKCNK